jgi:hypothetical protein
VSDDSNAQLDHTKKHGAPPLTRMQQRLATLVYTLQSQYQQYKDLSKTVLLGIEYRLFRLGYVPNVSTKLWFVITREQSRTLGSLVKFALGRY